jgi:hypothetical protein
MRLASGLGGDEEAVESRLSDEYTVRELPDRVNEIHK